MGKNRQFDAEKRHSLKHAGLAVLGLGAATVAGSVGASSPGDFVKKHPKLSEEPQIIEDPSNVLIPQDTIRFSGKAAGGGQPQGFSIIAPIQQLAAYGTDGLSYSPHILGFRYLPSNKFIALVHLDITDPVADEVNQALVLGQGTLKTDLRSQDGSNNITEIVEVHGSYSGFLNPFGAPAVRIGKLNDVELWVVSDSSFGAGDGAINLDATNNGTRNIIGTPYLSSIVTTSSNLTMTPKMCVVEATGGTGGITVTLPNLATALSNGQVVIIKKVDALAGAVTVTRAGADNIEGSASIILKTQWDSVTLIGDFSSGTWIRVTKNLGQTYLLSASETQANNTVPNADTNLKTFALPANSYSRIITEAEGYVQTTALSVQQDINIKIKYGAVQVGITMKFNPPIAAAGKIPFSIKASAFQAGTVTIAVTDGAALADANTTVFLDSLRVYGVQ